MTIKSILTLSAAAFIMFSGAAAVAHAADVPVTPKTVKAKSHDHKVKHQASKEVKKMEKSSKDAKATISGQ